MARKTNLIGMAQLIQAITMDIEKDLKGGVNLEDIRALNHALDYLESVVIEITPVEEDQDTIGNAMLI